jgi:hypothetical protein
MTETQRTELARERARAIVARLRASNEREAMRSGSDEPKVDYKDLERLMTRKLLRA